MTESPLHCFIYRLVPGAGVEYDTRHAEVWPEMTQLLAAEGIHDYRIFRRGDLVISVLRSTDDFAASLARLAASPVQQRWSASLAHLFVETHDQQGRPLFADEVFRHGLGSDA